MTENILAEFFIGCLLFVYGFILFSLGEVKTLYRCFKKKTVLPDPNGDLSTPTVIASVHPEVKVTWEASTSTGTSLRTSVSNRKPY